ncbi:hypothetical protein ACU686_10260 [Yinghuangia aomiensis]
MHDLGARGDQASHAFLAEALARVHPGDAVLSEEAADDRPSWPCPPTACGSSAHWTGTREFAEPGRRRAGASAAWPCRPAAHPPQSNVAIPASRHR